MNNYINRITKETYADRKEAKRKLGHANFNRLLKEGVIIYAPSDIII